MIKIKEQKGITLSSLVITIIVLIILAGIVLYLSLGNNGIFNKAKEAKEVTNKQEATEKINLKITNAQMNKYAEKQEMPTLQELADVLCEDNEIQYVTLESKVANKEKITVGEKTSIYTKLNQYPYEFEINSSLQLASIDGIKIATTQPNINSAYSDSEQIVGTWINNKPIYRKVFTFSENVQAYGNVRYIRKGVKEGVEDLINIGGYFTLNGRKINFGSSEINWDVKPTFHSYAEVEENNMYICILYYTANYSENPITGTVWMEYTKTTDIGNEETIPEN